MALQVAFAAVAAGLAPLVGPATGRDRRRVGTGG